MKNAFLSPFDVDFDHNWPRTADKGVESLHTNHSDVLVTGGSNSVRRVKTDSKRDFPMLRPQNKLMESYEAA